MRAAYAKDAHFDGLAATPDCVLRNGLWKHGVKETVLVPADNDLRDAIVKEAHATPACGHMGMNVILDCLRPWFYWEHGDLKMRDHVEAFVRKCESCQRKFRQTKSLVGYWGRSLCLKALG